MDEHQDVDPKPIIAFRYNWWENARNAWIVSLSGSIVLCGLFIPAILFVFGYRASTPNDTELSLSQGRVAPHDAVTKPLLVLEDDVQLKELISLLSVSATSSHDQAPAIPGSPKLPHEVVQEVMPAEPDNAAHEPKAAEEKSYDGEFYPVAHATKKPSSALCRENSS